MWGLFYTLRYLCKNISSKLFYKRFNICAYFYFDKFINLPNQRKFFIYPWGRQFIFAFSFDIHMYVALHTHMDFKVAQK